MKMKRIGIVTAVLLASGSALGQSGGGGSPKFDQPKDPPASPRSAEGRIDLRPKFERGQTIKLKLEVNNLAEQPTITVDPLEDPDDTRPGKAPARKPSSGNPQAKPEVEKTRSRIEFGIVMKVQDVDSTGNASVDMTFQTIKVSIDGPGLKEEFDSTRPAKPAKAGETDVIGTVLKPLVGSTLTMKVDRAGNISSVTGGEGFAMLGQIAPGAGGGGSLPQVFGPIFTIKKGDGFARIGESWENADKLESGLMGDFKMSTRHTLSGVSGTDARVDLKGRIEAGSQAPGPSTFQIKDSSFSGRYTWDVARGMIKDMTTKMSIRVEHKLQDTPVEIASETTTKLTRID